MRFSKVTEQPNYIIFYIYLLFGSMLAFRLGFLFARCVMTVCNIYLGGGGWVAFFCGERAHLKCISSIYLKSNCSSNTTATPSPMIFFRPCYTFITLNVMLSLIWTSFVKKERNVPFLFLWEHFIWTHYEQGYHFMKRFFQSLSGCRYLS